MRRVLTLIGDQRLAVLATRGADGAPYTSLVAVAASGDGWNLGFCTRRATQKFENLKAEPRVALLIDDRRGEVDNLRMATALTVIGAAHDVNGPERVVWEHALIDAHPSLGDFVRSPDCALFRVEVSRHVLVSQFERVVELIRPATPEGVVP